ncbi:MAG: HEPN domain-containing protein [bacterium]
MGGNYLHKCNARAIAYLRDALDDLESGYDLLTNNRYSKALFHFQQATEKSMKGCLAILGKLVIKEHKCTNIFKRFVIPALSKKMREGFTEIMSDLRELEWTYIPTRYSVTIAGEIRLKEYDEKDIQYASSIAQECLDLTYSFIEEKTNRTLPRDLEGLTRYLRENYPDVVNGDW